MRPRVSESSRARRGAGRRRENGGVAESRCGILFSSCEVQEEELQLPVGTFKLLVARAAGCPPHCAGLSRTVRSASTPRPRWRSPRTTGDWGTLSLCPRRCSRTGADCRAVVRHLSCDRRRRAAWRAWCAEITSTGGTRCRAAERTCTSCASRVCISACGAPADLPVHHGMTAAGAQIRDHHADGSGANGDSVPDAAVCEALRHRRHQGEHQQGERAARTRIQLAR